MSLRIPAFVCTEVHEFETWIDRLSDGALILESPVSIEVGARVAVTFFSVAIEGRVMGCQATRPHVVHVGFKTSDDVRRLIERQMLEHTSLLSEMARSRARAAAARAWAIEEATEPSAPASPAALEEFPIDVDDSGLDTTVRGDDEQLQVLSIDPSRDLEVEETIPAAPPALPALSPPAVPARGEQGAFARDVTLFEGGELNKRRWGLSTGDPERERANNGGSRRPKEVGDQEARGQELEELLGRICGAAEETDENWNERPLRGGGRLDPDAPTLPGPRRSRLGD